MLKELKRVIAKANQDYPMTDLGFVQMETAVADLRRIATPKNLSKLLAAMEEMAEALRKIASPTQTTDLLWWQIEAREALAHYEEIAE